MTIKCQFNLSRSAGVYYTGEQISGTVKLTVTKKPLQVEGICVELLGETTTSWQEDVKCLLHVEHNDGSARQRDPLQINYVATKTHTEQRLPLVADALVLPLGSIELRKFSFDLPHDLPGSCRLPHGSTNYTLKLTLERRSKHAKIFQQRLCIRDRIELPHLLPATSESDDLRLSLPRSVYVPGQRVAYELETFNQSNPKYTTRLCQCISYGSQLPLVKRKQVIRVLDESCHMADALHLPLTMPIMRQLPSELIEIKYYLETLCKDSQRLRLPLLVGNVAPPIDAPLNHHSNCFDNLGLSENELLFSSINQLQPHPHISREIASTNCGRQSEQLRLLRRRKKQSYLRLALRYFSKTLANH